MTKDELLLRFPYYSIVNTNVFHIPERLKEIDSSYFVVRNHKTKKFEVHSSKNIGFSRCFVVPFEELDVRTIDYAKETYVGYRGKEIFTEIDRHNQKLEESERRKMKDDYYVRALESRNLFKEDAFYL